MKEAVETVVESLSLLTSEVTAITARMQSLLNEIADVRDGDQHELSIEIAQTEEGLIQLRDNIQAMFNDPGVELSKLVQISAREAECQAYLKGLKFNACCRQNV
jgi:predicted  nucleic acid-binding Zn-ribbon protein